MANADTAPVLDRDWVRASNLLPTQPGQNMPLTDGEEVYYRSFTSASYKFTDSLPGGNFALNMPPQPCRFADLVPKRYIQISEVEEEMKKYRTDGRDLLGPIGLSRWYSENIDDHAVLLHMRFGVPAYNSLWGFFSNFYSSDDARLVKTGRGSLGAFIGKAVGWVFSVPFLPYVLLGSGISFFLGNTTTKFAYLKPTMGQYWRYVTDIVNEIAAGLDITAKGDSSYLKLAENSQTNQNTNVNMGQTTGATPSTESQWLTNTNLEVDGKNGITNSVFALDDAEKNYYQGLLPRIYQSSGSVGINVYALVLRAQSLADGWNTAVQEEQDRIKEGGYTGRGFMESIMSWVEGGGANNKLNDHYRNRQYKTIEEYLSDYYNNAEGKNRTSNGTDVVAAENGLAASIIAQTNAAATAQSNSESSNGDGGTSTSTGSDAATEQNYFDKVSAWANAASESVSKWFEDMGEYGSETWKMFKAGQHEGSQYVTLRVNGRDSASESFSNTSRKPDIANWVNTTSSSIRNKFINAADGTILGGGVGKLAGEIAGFIGNAVQGLADSLHIGGIAALAGNAFVDIPDHYDESSATFNQMSYSFRLLAPYGCDHSRIIQEILPLATILAGGLCRATGASSYNGPFMLEAFCRGRGHISYGMISDISLTRAVSNAPWTDDGSFRGIDVRITIKDMSSIMYMAQNRAFGITDLVNPGQMSRLLIPSDSTFNNYMAVLSAQGLAETLYKSRRFARNLDKVTMDFRTYFTRENMVNRIFNGSIGQVLSALSKTDRS